MEKRENPLARKGADVAKWIKAVDCESTMRGFNSRRSPITFFQMKKKNSIFNIPIYGDEE